MWTKVKPEYLMGRIIDDTTTYHRLVLLYSDADYSARAKYDCGVYFVFSCKTSKLNIKTKVHYKPTTDNRKVAGEIQVLGKIENDDYWELLNITYRYPKALADKETILSFILPHRYSEFQVCLPAQGRIDDVLDIETDTEPIFYKLPLKAVFLGSSVAQDNNSSSHMNLCCYLYRKLGINVATVGISHHNTITCPEVLEKLLLLPQETKFIVMDLINLTAEDLDNFRQLFTDRHLHFLVVNCRCKYEVVNLLTNNKDIEVIDINADGHYDRIHLNDYGTVLYCEALQNKKLL